MTVALAAETACRSLITGRPRSVPGKAPLSKERLLHRRSSSLDHGLFFLGSNDTTIANAAQSLNIHMHCDYIFQKIMARRDNTNPLQKAQQLTIMRQPNKTKPSRFRSISSTTRLNFQMAAKYRPQDPSLCIWQPAS